MKKRKKASSVIEKVMNLIFTFCGFSAVIFVLVITAFLVVSGVPAIGKIGVTEFLFGKVWASTAAEPKYGILPFILTTVYGTVGAVILGVPVGILCAVFIAKGRFPKTARAVNACVELLAGIPSVVYGLFGMIIIVPFVRSYFDLPDGATLFAAIIVLAVMILPSVISVSVTALSAVPREYEEASLALGATKTETTFYITLKAAKSGIFTAVIMGVGRSIGEAMAVMMVSGNVANMPGLFKSVRFLTTAVASEMSYSSGLQREALYSVALILFVFILFINIGLASWAKREDK